MDYLTTLCDEINRLNYYNQCEYIKNKLLSLDLYDIQYILFFKKLHVLFDDLHGHIKKISRDDWRDIYNFSIELADYDGYFNETRGYIHINFEKITFILLRYL